MSPPGRSCCLARSGEPVNCLSESCALRPRANGLNLAVSVSRYLPCGMLAPADLAGLASVILREEWVSPGESGYFWTMLTHAPTDPEPLVADTKPNSHCLRPPLWPFGMLWVAASTWAKMPSHQTKDRKKQRRLLASFSSGVGRA